MKTPLLTTLALLLAAIPAAQATDTLLHYRVNDGDVLTSGVPSLGTLGAGILSGPGVTLSDDVPTLGVPPTAGDRSLLFNGSDGILAPGTRQLLNADIHAAGGFTYEAWFRYTGGGTVNSIIDYAGTEKLRHLASGTEVSMQTNAVISHDIGTAPNDEWHYAAIVFTPTSPAADLPNVTGDYTFYFDDNTTPADTIIGVEITDFGDGLTPARTIGVGMHPEGFTGDFFNGLIFEPRVTLGALHPAQFLFHTNITTVTTEVDEDSSGLTGDISLREAINNSPANSLIVFNPALDGKTITLAEGQLLIDQSLTIDATSLSKGITIDANQQSRVMRINPNNSVALHGLTLTGGKATNAFGGAIYADGSGVGNAVHLSLSACTLSGNSASSGGGIHSSSFQGSATLSLSACTLSGNSANFGGGIYSDGAVGSATLSLSACTLSANSAKDFGGGIEASGTTLTIHHSTLSGNHAGNAGGGINILGGSNAELSNTIIAQNSAVETANHDLHIDTDVGGGTFTSVSTNLIGAVGNSGLSNENNSVIVDPAPILAPLGHYGGPTQTMHPLAGSPAIRTGETDTTRTDPRGFTLTGPPTIGAVKLGPLTIVSSLADNSLSTLNYTDHDGDILEISYDPSNLGAGMSKIVVNGTEVSTSSSIANGITTIYPSAPVILTFLGAGAADILVLSGGTVTTATGGFSALDGLLTLNTTFRQAITANADTPGAVIRFDPVLSRRTIALAGTQLEVPSITNGLFIDASDITGGITIDAQENSRIMEIQPAATIALHGLTLTGGEHDSRGAAIYSDHATLSLSHCTISGNSTERFGGGIYSEGRGTGASAALSRGTILNLSHCTLSENSTRDGSGGAIHISGEEGGSAILNLRHCTLSGNLARDGKGGAIYSYGGEDRGSVHTRLVHCTLYGNSAEEEGGGIHHDGRDGNSTLILQNTILAGNSAPTGPDLRVRGTATEAVTIATGVNLISSLLGSNISDPPPAEIKIFAAAAIKLTPLGDYGGSTQTMPPLPSSPAINMATTSTRTQDQRGFTKINGIPDIGAVEIQDETDFKINLSIAWETDYDQDGNTFGVEFTLGTDPFTPDNSDPANLSVYFASGGQPSIEFGYNADAVDYSIWIIERSTDLNSWSIYQEKTNPGGPFSIFATNGSDGTFYRFRAKLVE